MTEFEELEQYRAIGSVEECEEMKRIVERKTKGEMQRELYKIAAEKIKKYYEAGEPENTDIGRAIKEVEKKRKDSEIIQKYYKEKKTTEKIGEEMNYDQSTIARKKKSLCLAIYWQMERNRRR